MSQPDIFHYCLNKITQTSCTNCFYKGCYCYLWVSRHKTVDIVVDLLEHKSSVHQVKTALQNEGGNASVIIYSTRNTLIFKLQATVTVDPDLDKDCQAVVGVSGGIQVVFVFLSDVWHHHVDQSLHSVMEGR